MLLCNRLNDPRATIRAGMFCLLLATLSRWFVHPASDFWTGFTQGVTVVLFVVSIVLNLRWVTLHRRIDQGGGR
jgi:hypothetical protein